MYRAPLISQGRVVQPFRGKTIFRRLVQCLEEIRRLHAQSHDDFHDVGERQIALPALYTAHVAAVDTASISKPLLRIAAFGAVLADGFAEDNKKNWFLF